MALLWGEGYVNTPLHNSLNLQKVLALSESLTSSFEVKNYPISPKSRDLDITSHYITLVLLKGMSLYVFICNLVNITLKRPVSRFRQLKSFRE